MLSHITYIRGIFRPESNQPEFLQKYLLNAGLLQKYYHKEILMHYEPYRVFVKEFAKNNA